MTRKSQVLIICALALLGLAILAAPALAASQVGQRLGDEVKTWGSALLLGVACLVGLPALAKREVNQAMIIAMIVLVLGGFIFASDQVEDAITAIWRVLGG